MLSVDNTTTAAFNNAFLAVQSVFLPLEDSEWLCTVHTIKFLVESIFLFPLFDNFCDITMR